MITNSPLLENFYFIFYKYVIEELKMSKHKRRKHNTGKPKAGNTDKPQVATTRNPLFNHPLMSKSHHHEKKYKAVRKAEKVKLHKNYDSQGTYDVQKILRGLQGFLNIVCHMNINNSGLLPARGNES